MSYDSEARFEADLIRTLVEEKGWKDGVLQYKDEKDLIQNWANIIYENNRSVDRLGDYPITQGEMQQILEQMKALKTPLKLNGFINGGCVQIIRDNEQDVHNFGKMISLKIFDRNEIAAGRTRYQIAEQPIFHARNEVYPKRRGDFCLLINGMPLIHVELKKSGVPVSDAQYQIVKYLQEGVFSGLFSLVQIFVAMNPEECVYFANPGRAEFYNKKFCFHWADQYNNPINDWNTIAERLLSIPMAHELIGFYTVADQTDNTLKVMRSYQYYAVSKISRRVSEMKWDDQNIYGGYVWHTTGSGKTMTSFKAAQMIDNSKDADKVVFLMDRIELGTQSLREYRGFADETDEVQSTENTEILVGKLKSDSTKDTLIVTSIQKMSRIRPDESINIADIQKINQKRIVFIVDECHRSVFGEMLATIKHTFPRAIFIGFSGTPILEINKKKDTTTADVFGDELKGTRYTIADGMRDGNVLGFDTIPQPTYKDYDLRTVIALEKAKVDDVTEIFGNARKEAIYYHWMNEVPMGADLDEEGNELESIEAQLTDAQYDRDEHRTAVVDDILQNWVPQSHNGKFHAMLATSSIPEAIKYYHEIKSRNSGLKITAVFDPHDGNNQKSFDKIEGIAGILIDYGNTFGVKYNIPGYAAFKRDVCARLAHKDAYVAIENEPEKCLDLLIVVDQMLTGYDSKWLNTLYMDKFYKWTNIEMIIQAFSRTNRVFTDDKSHGIIRYYRRPYTMKNIVEYAFEQYSGNKPYGIFVPKLKENLEAMNKCYEEIHRLFEVAGISDFSRLPDDVTEKRKFARLFREINQHLEPAKVQGFIWEELTYEFNTVDGEKESYSLKFDEHTFDTLLQRYKELSRGRDAGDSADEAYDIDPYLMSLSTEKIDSDYMDSRFKKYVKLLNDHADEETINHMLNELHRSFSSLSQEEQKFANLLLKDIQNHDLVVSDEKNVREYIIEYQMRAKSDQISTFAERLGIYEQKLRQIMEKHVTEEDINAFGQYDELIQNIDIETAKRYFDEKENTDIPKRKVRAKLDHLLRTFILEGGFDI
ncbi:type I restriction endonuclease subunit R [Faecalicatena contorta]|uniref:type I restriction endonuclease subunit R n=1 Tax=Faecalicatena contorta TaxID=39482 RepID=UPI001F35D610|nr:HsdR family type I site-specific deoxyribonuclease [Faecalicatena contorta]MCF2682634.1 type I restriction endonuclease subunit R [Faecalicatena contorta]